MSQFKVGDFVRLVDPDEREHKILRDYGLDIGRVYQVSNVRVAEYPGGKHEIRLRGHEGSGSWFAYRFELATDFRKGDHVRVKSNACACGMPGCKDSLGKVLEVSDARGEAVYVGSGIGYWPGQLEHVGCDAPLSESSSSSTSLGSISGEVKKEAPVLKAGMKVRVTKPMSDPSEPHWDERMDIYAGREFEVSRSDGYFDNAWRLVGCDNWAFSERWLTPVDGAVSFAAFSVGVVLVGAIAAVLPFVGIKMMAVAGWKWAAKKASAARAWLNRRDLAQAVILWSAFSCTAGAAGLLVDRLNDDWIRHECAANSVRVPEFMDERDRFVRIFNEATRKPVVIEKPKATGWY